MNKQNLSNLIALGEGFTTEFKRTGTSNLGREICAFANATGDIILGNSKALQVILRPFENDTGQVAGQVTGQVLIHCVEPRTGREIQELLGLKHRETFLNNYLKPLLKSGWIEMTSPDKPTSSKQKYRITEKGRALLAEIEGVQE